MNTYLHQKGILLLVIVLGTISAATEGSVRVLPGSKPPPVQESKFDGIWVGPGNVTLIKQLRGYIILQGKDKESTWSARGVIIGDRILCRGTGVTNNGDEFVFESSMMLKDGILKDSWKAIFVGGKELQGDDELKRVEVDQPKGASPMR